MTSVDENQRENKTMAKKNSVKAYENELCEMIKVRTGQPCEVWIMPQVRATAYNMALIDKMQEEIMSSGKLVDRTLGSKDQPVDNVNPLVSLVDKAQRTLMLQFESLGLNYKTTPSKMTDDTKKGGAEHDKMQELINDVRNA